MARDLRRLAAIVSADVAGYSRLMGRNESGTLAALKAHRSELIDPKIAEYGGRIVKTSGDGLLLEFPSVVEAVRCAVDVQRGMTERNAGVPPDHRIEFRIGVNVGDIIIDSGDIFGDGVNVAARLQELAVACGICVSGRVQEDLRGKLDFAFDDAGEHQLKNIAWPVRVFRLRLDGALRATQAPLTLPDKPSIAVLPFQNISGDPEQEYFADGVVEEIITALSRMRWLFVIARNSSFTYKGRAVDVKQVGRELGARYVLEGSVRKAANRVRISGQLIDSITGAHLWADRFEGALEGIFELQDQVTESVVGAIAPNLEKAEIERARRKPTESLDAYDYYLRGMASIYQWTREAQDEGLRLFNRAIELDPDFASAHGMAARCYVLRIAHGWMADEPREIADCVRLARRAAELGKTDAVALSLAGFALARAGDGLATAAALIDRALALNPNLATAWLYGGYIKVWDGDPAAGIEHLMRAMRLSPLDPQIFNIQSGIALAHFHAGRYDEALAWVAKAQMEHANFAPTARHAAAINAHAGRMGEAQKAVAQLLQINPACRLSNISDPYRRPEDRALLIEGLRMAGLPE
jgi:TolB-like protein